MLPCIQYISMFVEIIRQSRIKKVSAYYAKYLNGSTLKTSVMPLGKTNQTCFAACCLDTLGTCFEVDLFVILSVILMPFLFAPSCYGM